MLRALFQLAALLAAQDNCGRTVLTYAATSDRHVMETVLNVMATTLSAEKVTIYVQYIHIFNLPRGCLEKTVFFRQLLFVVPSTQRVYARTLPACQSVGFMATLDAGCSVLHA